MENFKNDGSVKSLTSLILKMSFRTQTLNGYLFY